MQVISFGAKLNSDIVVCLGYFACMHLGHIELVNQAKTLAKDNNCKLAIFTFENDVLNIQGKNNKAIFTYKERLQLYENIGVDFVITANFDNNFKQTLGVDFLQQLSKYNLKAIVCGYDYTCGCDKIGSSQVVNYFSVHNIPVVIVDQVKYLSQKISTSLICNLLVNNRLDILNKLLFNPYYLSGKVVLGRQVGSKIGFPTANIDVSPNKLLPIGVFCGYCFVKDMKYRCVINIGSKPTFDINSSTVEVNLIDFNDNLYEQELVVYITKFLRDIVKFDTLEELTEQLTKDREAALID